MPGFGPLLHSLVPLIHIPNAGPGVRLQCDLKESCERPRTAGRARRTVAFPRNFSLSRHLPRLTLGPLLSGSLLPPPARSLTPFLSFPLLHHYPRRSSRLPASSPASAAEGIHPRVSEICIVSRPSKRSLVSLCSSRPMIGEPPRVICMPAAARCPAVQATLA